jgi:tetratricopeptide (TPR) repeat protein
MIRPRRKDLARNAASWVVALTIWLSFLWACRAETPAASFDSANKYYEQGKFTEATAAYEGILKSGRASTAIYFNLGNAFFKTGQIGRAICAYREAKAMAPRDPDVIANLRFARNQVQGPTLAENPLELWVAKLNLNEWTALACGTAWALLLMLTVPQWWPSLKPALRGCSIALAIATLMVSACLGFASSRLHFRPKAVVIIPAAIVHQAPLAESPGPTTLHDGAETRVLDRKGEWLQVMTDPRRVGWVRRDEVSLTQTE